MKPAIAAIIPISARLNQSNIFTDPLHVSHQLCSAKDFSAGAISIKEGIDVIRLYIFYRQKCKDSKRFWKQISRTGRVAFGMAAPLMMRILCMGI
jgi:hypothetical protein